MADEGIFQKRSTYGMLFLILFAAGVTAIILLAYIKTITVISDLENSPAYATRQSLLRDGVKQNKK